MCSCPHLSLVIKVRFKYAKDTLFMIKICPCFVISFSLYWFWFVIYDWSYAFTFLIFKYVISLCILCSVLWATAKMLYSHLSDLLRMGCSAHLLSMGKGRGAIPSECNSLPPGAAWFCRSTTSSISVKPKVISPPWIYLAPHRNYGFGNWVEKMGDYQSQGRGT